MHVVVAVVTVLFIFIFYAFTDVFVEAVLVKVSLIHYETNQEAILVSDRKYRSSWHRSRVRVRVRSYDESTFITESPPPPTSPPNTLTPPTPPNIPPSFECKESVAVAVAVAAALLEPFRLAFILE
jgi:hypothetical protein